MNEWVVWSFEHEAWWRPGGWGYTPSLADAGRYSEREALRIERAANIVAENERALMLADALAHGIPQRRP